jgi:hypothetical protein
MRPHEVIHAALCRNALERFERALRSVEGIYRRRDKGETTGRNATSTDLTLDHRLGELRGLLDCDEVTDALDARPGLARRWNRVERRVAGLPE